MKRCRDCKHWYPNLENVKKNAPDTIKLIVSTCEAIIDDTSREAYLEITDPGYAFLYVNENFHCKLWEEDK